MKAPWNISAKEASWDLGLYASSGTTSQAKREIEQKYGLVPGGYIEQDVRKFLSTLADGRPHAEAFTVMFGPKRRYGR